MVEERNECRIVSYYKHTFNVKENEKMGYFFLSLYLLFEIWIELAEKLFLQISNTIVSWKWTDRQGHTSSVNMVTVRFWLMFIPVQQTIDLPPTNVFQSLPDHFREKIKPNNLPISEVSIFCPYWIIWETI